jgi:hypothetical protein
LRKEGTFWRGSRVGSGKMTKNVEHRIETPKMQTKANANPDRSRKTEPEEAMLDSEKASLSRASIAATADSSTCTVEAVLWLCRMRGCLCSAARLMKRQANARTTEQHQSAYRHVLAEAWSKAGSVDPCARLRRRRSKAHREWHRPVGGGGPRRGRHSADAGRAAGAHVLAETSRAVASQGSATTRGPSEGRCQILGYAGEGSLVGPCWPAAGGTLDPAATATAARLECLRDRLASLAPPPPIHRAGASVPTLPIRAGWPSGARAGPGSRAGCGAAPGQRVPE